MPGGFLAAGNDFSLVASHEVPKACPDGTNLSRFCESTTLKFLIHMGHMNPKEQYKMGDKKIPSYQVVS